MVATLFSAHKTCDEIVKSVKSSNLHFILQETPHSVYLTIRKKCVKNCEENNRSKIETETLRMQIDSSNKKQIKDDIGVIPYLPAPNNIVNLFSHPKAS